MNDPKLFPDYLDAMDRHWLDAEVLFKKQPQGLANADQLYGLSAECGLKALMLKLGMKLKDNRPEHKKDQKHADAIWCRYETYRQGRMTAAVLALNPNKKPFSDWRIHHRYASRSCFQQGEVQKHKEGADEVKKIVEHARNMGLLP